MQNTNTATTSTTATCVSTPYELKTMSLQDREAAFGMDTSYSKRFAQMTKEYHINGRFWSNSQLEIMFREGLLQYYIKRTGGFCFETYKNQNEISGPPRITVLPFHNSKLTTQQISEINSVMFQLFSKLKELPILLKLGADFQRIKQELECREELKTNSIICQKDQELENIQTYIYSWVCGFSEEARIFIDMQQCRGKDTEEKIAYLNQKVNAFTPTRIPNFIPKAFYTERSYEDWKAIPQEQALVQLEAYLDKSIQETTAPKNFSAYNRITNKFVTLMKHALDYGKQTQILQAAFFFIITQKERGDEGFCFISEFISAINNPKILYQFLESMPEEIKIVLQRGTKKIDSFDPRVRACLYDIIANAIGDKNHNVTLSAQKRAEELQHINTALVNMLEYPQELVQQLIDGYEKKSSTNSNTSSSKNSGCAIC